MSLVLAGVVLVGTSGFLAVSRWLQKRRGDTEQSGTVQDGAEERDATPRAARAGATRLDGFACQLGDVLLRLTGEEAWLAGALVLSEELDVAVLFVAPDAVHDTVVYVRPHPRADVWWLTSVDPDAALVAGEPPSAVEQGGIRFERTRRLPLRSRRIGVGSPDVGDSVIVAEYASAGAERLVVLKGSSGKSFAYRGLELDPGSFEVIASGASTLEP